MKKLLSYVCILSAIACQPAHARDYYRNYEPVGHNYSDYARVPQERYHRYERPQSEPKRYESPRFTRLTNEQANDTPLKRKVIGETALPFRPYIGVDGAIGEIKYEDEEAKFLFNKSLKRLGVFGGLQFNQYIGLEAFYNTGNVKDKKHSTSFTEFSDLGIKDSLDFTSYGLDLLGYLPVHQSVDIILGLGYGWYKFDAKIDAEFTSYSAGVNETLKLKLKEKDEAIRFSLGAQYLINDNWALRILGRYADFSDGDVIKNMMEVSLGLRYTF